MHIVKYIYIKQKVKEQFGDEIFITKLNGNPDVVTFRSNASAILFEFYKEQRTNLKQCASSTQQQN